MHYYECDKKIKSWKGMFWVWNVLYWFCRQFSILPIPECFFEPPVNLEQFSAQNRLPGMWNGHFCFNPKCFKFKILHIIVLHVIPFFLCKYIIEHFLWNQPQSKFSGITPKLWIPKHQYYNHIKLFIVIVFLPNQFYNNCILF